MLTEEEVKHHLTNIEHETRLHVRYKKDAHLDAIQASKLAVSHAYSEQNKIIAKLSAELKALKGESE